MVYSRNLLFHLRTRVQRLGKLLRDGAASSLAGIAEQDGLEQNAAETDEVYARVPVEPDIFRGHCRVDKVLGKLVIGDIGPVLDMECGKDLTVFGNDLCRKLVVRVLQFGE